MRKKRVAVGWERIRLGYWMTLLSFLIVLALGGLIIGGLFFAGVSFTMIQMMFSWIILLLLFVWWFVLKIPIAKLGAAMFGYTYQSRRRGIKRQRRR